MDMTVEVSKKGGVNEIQKRIELPVSTHYEDNKNKSGILQRVDVFVWRILKGDRKNKPGTLEHVDEFVRRILKGDKKNKPGIQQRVDEFIWRIQKGDRKNKPGTLQRVDEFVRRILKGDEKNKHGIQQRVDEFVWRRQEEQIRNTEAHRVAREDPVRRMEQQQQDLIQYQEARADPQYSAQEQQANNARRQQVRAGIQANFRALNYQPDNFVNTTSVGLLSVQCQICGALKFSKETDGFCCSKGNVKLDAFPQPQPFLQHLYEGTDSDSKHFLSNIRKYNCAFQMTSFDCNEVSMAGFNPSFRIQGQVYHLIGSMVPTAGESPKFAQIYFIDNRESEVRSCSVCNS